MTVTDSNRIYTNLEVRGLGQLHFQIDFVFLAVLLLFGLLCLLFLLLGLLPRMLLALEVLRNEISQWCVEPRTRLCSILGVFKTQHMFLSNAVFVT